MAIFSLLLSGLLIGWQMMKLLKQPNEMKVEFMSELTQSMKTVCIGRYLVDVPSSFVLNIPLANVDGFDIRPAKVSMPSLDLFRERNQVDENKWRQIAHKTEASLLRESIRVGGDGHIFSYRESARHNRTLMIQARKWLNTREYWLKQESIISDEEKDIEKAKATLNK
ncbi:MAG: hypothetical protein ING17_08230 [Burkholderiales bacterium]|jgi:hypothetical protein|nr:hypothetical protein [Burkholderiales bacterium]MCA3164436.1 hypothetical protein [Burkholderiales bacterium]MCA3172391.1 hypothetical protein [Burkholderiales bacterium]